MWLITVNIAQRCSNTRTDPQNDDAKHSGKLHNLCRITELVQRELRSCESRLTNFANPVRNPSQNAQDRLQAFTDTSSTCPEPCSAWSGRPPSERLSFVARRIALKQGRTSDIAASAHSQDSLL